jgi:hypothetical protein
MLGKEENWPKGKKARSSNLSRSKLASQENDDRRDCDGTQGPVV